MPCLERFFSNPRKSDRVECVLSCFRGLPLCWYLPNSPDRVDPRPGSPAASGFFAYGFDQCIQPWAVGRGLAQTYRRRDPPPRSAAAIRRSAQVDPPRSILDPAIRSGDPRSGDPISCALGDPIRRSALGDPISCALGDPAIRDPRSAILDPRSAVRRWTSKVEQAIRGGRQKSSRRSGPGSPGDRVI